MSMWIDFCFICKGKTTDLFVQSNSVMEQNGWTFNSVYNGEYSYYKDVSRQKIVHFKEAIKGETSVCDAIEEISKHKLPTIYYQKDFGEYKSKAVVSVSGIKGSLLKEVEISFENDVICLIGGEEKENNKAILEKVFCALVKELSPLCAISGTEINGIKPSRDQIKQTLENRGDLTFFSDNCIKKFSISFDGISPDDSVITADNDLHGVIIKRKKLFEI